MWRRLSNKINTHFSLPFLTRNQHCCKLNFVLFVQTKQKSYAISTKKEVFCQHAWLHSLSCLCLSVLTVAVLFCSQLMVGRQVDNWCQLKRNFGNLLSFSKGKPVENKKNKVLFLYCQQRLKWKPREEQQVSCLLFFLQQAQRTFSLVK